MTKRMGAMDQVTFVPIPYVCSGKVLDRVEDVRSSYKVAVYKSPIGEFNGEIHAEPIYHGDNNYRKGDRVKLLITFIYGGTPPKVQDLTPGCEAYILGRFDEQTIIPKMPTNPSSPLSEDSVRLHNSRSTSAVAVYDNGDIKLSTNSALYDLLSSKGNGSNRDARVSYAQNFQNIISNNPPYFIAREHFGMYTGEDEADMLTRITPDMSYITYRRYVPQSRDILNWTSTCEGTFSPFLGPNNGVSEVKQGRQTLFYKVINAGTSRITVDAGAPGDGFLTLRIDRVILGEKTLGISPGAITGVFGNLFKMKVGDDGAFEISGGSKGIPFANFNGFKMKCDTSGNLSIQTSNSMVLTTGDGEDAINSINISTTGAIDIKTSSGFTVNGAPLVHKAFLDWFVQNFPAMFICAAPGAPAVPNPAALATLMAQYPLPSITGGMATSGVPAPLPGLIIDPDEFTSI